MILQEAVDNFAFRLGKSTDVVAKEKIETDILTAYATIVERKLGKRSMANTGLLDSIVVETVEAKEDNVFPRGEIYTEIQKMRVSNIEIPRALAKSSQDCPYAVTSLNGENSFTYIRPDRIKHRHRKVSKFIAENTPSYFTFIGRKIYSYDLPDKIRVVFIPANPKEVAILKRENDSDELIVHIDNDIFNGVKALLVDEYPEYAPLKKESREIDSVANDNVG